LAGGHTLNLQDQVLAVMWLTPSANEDAAGTPEGKMQRMLTQQAKEVSPELWSTPRASDGEKGGPNQAFGAGGEPLAAQTVNWPSVTVADSRASPSLTAGGAATREGYTPGMTLTDAIRIYSLPDLATYPVGEIPSRDRRSLNPLFVEWLMGWPPGWTLLAWTDLGCSATALSLWRQRMRSALSSLASPQEAPPEQLSFFG
jgi:hypothetical protein